MKTLNTLSAIAFGSIATLSIALPAQANTAITGIVERVWEDGFRLNTGSRVIVVDT